ncbi:MAG TPA: DNA-directed RNA polymerase subunit alpha [Chloroflexia bacterium]|nr:DNA-directed RNA polymerase subunit alpha [Chloroflexia bacterium]
MSNATTAILPNVRAVATTTNYGRFVIGPLEAGMGIPLGNALRRILLSSLPGSAVTSVRLQNVYHEFSCIPSVREDVTEIVLNVKNIRLRAYSDRSIRLQLTKRGAGEVRAGDIDVPANVELVNPDLVLATLDNDDAQFEMELTVERGRGYVSFEAREGLPIGSIPVDATFSPIPKVNYLVEDADLELLSEVRDEEDEAPALTADDVIGREQVLIEIWSDGTIDPGEALSLAAQYLSQHSSLIANFNRVVAAPQGREIPGIDIPAHLFEMSIEDLSLSMRTYNCLKRSGVTKVGQILRMDKKELLGLRNFGEKSFDELYEVLSSRDLIPAGTPLDVSAGEPVGGGGDDADTDDDSDLEDGDIEIAYAEMTDDASEPEFFLAQPDVEIDSQGTQIVDELGVSEGSAAMAAGIFVDDEPASAEMDVLESPDMVEAGSIDSDAKPKKGKKK